MYENIKNILPHNLLKKNEAFIRRLIYFFYKGNKNQCPICQKQLSRFVILKNGEKLCPACGSLARYRRLWIMIKPLLNPGISVLDFSPPLCFYKQLKSLKGIRYVSTDYQGKFAADHHLDITNTHLPPQNFDIIICYHILEHIEEDEKAIG